MPRLTAGDLNAGHCNRLVTVSTETGESITFTLEHVEDVPAVKARPPYVGLDGVALGNAVDLVLAPWQPVHVFTEDLSPTAKAAAL